MNTLEMVKNNKTRKRDDLYANDSYNTVYSDTVEFNGFPFRNKSGDD